MGKTIDIIKEKRKASSHVKQLIKDSNAMKKQIVKVLESGEKTIPEIVSETGLTSDVVTYHLMTLQKFGKVEAGEVDDMDEYYYYKLKK